MQPATTTPDEYIAALPAGKQEAIKKLRSHIKKNIPKGFKEVMSYGMLGYVVPHSIYAGGYHCNPALPLPFISVAAQKNFIALYHMGIYLNDALMQWFVNEYPKHTKAKLDMGKSCIRFKKIDDIPFELIGKLAAKITVQQWINIYEKTLSSKKN
jgi:Domain of unknown function (DU1801)